jgi:hypothetical protein
VPGASSHPRHTPTKAGVGRSTLAGLSGGVRNLTFTSRNGGKDTTLHLFGVPKATRAELDELRTEVDQLRSAITGAGAALALPPRPATGTPATPSPDHPQ